MTRWPRKQLLISTKLSTQRRRGWGSGTTGREVKLGRRWSEAKRYISNKCRCFFVDVRWCVQVGGKWDNCFLAREMQNCASRNFQRWRHVKINSDLLLSRVFWLAVAMNSFCSVLLSAAKLCQQEFPAMATRRDELRSFVEQRLLVGGGNEQFLFCSVLFIATANQKTLLNKRSELISTCRHRRKFLLAQFCSTEHPS